MERVCGCAGSNIKIGKNLEKRFQQKCRLFSTILGYKFQYCMYGGGVTGGAENSPTAHPQLTTPQSDPCSVPSL